MPNQERITFKIWLKSFTRLEVILIIILILSIAATIIQIFALVSKSKPHDRDIDYSRQLIDTGWQKNYTFLEKNQYGFLAALCDTNNLFKIACVLSIVSSKWLITTSSCIKNIDNLNEYKIIEDIMTSALVKHEIDGVMYHPHGDVVNDIALIRSKNELMTSKECFLYAVSPRLKVRLVINDMLILLKLNRIADGDNAIRLQVSGTPIFLLKNSSETIVQNAPDGSPIVRGNAIYALISSNGRLMSITKHIEWIRDNILNENELRYDVIQD